MKVSETNTIDSKISSLLEITDEFVFPAYYSNTNCVMWKISNPFTELAGETLVLCPISEGIEKAIDLAIKHIGDKRVKFYTPTNQNDESK